MMAKDEFQGGLDEGRPALCEGPAPVVTYQVNTKGVTLT